MTDKAAVEDHDKQAEINFDAGFNQDAPPPEKTEAKPAIETKKGEPLKPKVELKVAAKVAPKEEPPEYVQLTKADLESLKSAAVKTASFDAQFSKLFGTMGAMQQVVKNLQSQTPKGEAVELPKATFAKLRTAFPDIADLLESDFEEATKGLRGTAPADAPEPEAAQKLVDTAIEAGIAKREMKALGKAHPNWREIVGAVDSEGKHDPDNEFRKWLATQPVSYQSEVNAADTAAEVREAIDKFLASKQPAQSEQTPAPKDAARRDRIQQAIQPRGDGGQPPPNNTAADAFTEGFRTG